MATTLTIRLDEPLRKELARISRAEGIPVSAYVRKTLTKSIALRGFREARARLIPYAKAAGYFTDEDVFKIKT